MIRDTPKALMFDVFGTVVDWRTSVAKHLEQFAAENNLDIDSHQFADEWRSLYQPSMSNVREGKRPWGTLDVLHLESLVHLLEKHGHNIEDEAKLKELNKAWHFLEPWPDSVEGLHRLKTKFILSTQSNGNVSLLVDMAKYSGLPWDVVLCAETAKAYKPVPASYLKNIALLDLEPGECMMVAAHNEDLHAAQSLGMQTAFVARPAEHGPNQTIDLEPSGNWEYSVGSFTQLADRLGC